MGEDKELKEVISGWLDDYTWSLRSAEVSFQLDKNPEKYSESQFNIRSKIVDMIISKCKREFKDERMYSEDEVRELLMKALTHNDDNLCGSLVTVQKEIRTANFNVWFEDNKKK